MSEARVEVRVRRAAEDGALADLWVAAWQAACADKAWADRAASIDFAARRPWILSLLAKPRAMTRIAHLAGRPVGFAIAEAAYLHQLVVAPDAARRGVGTALLRDMIQRSGALELDVNADNNAARAFYAHHGFVEIGRGFNASSGLAIIRLRRTPTGP